MGVRGRILALKLLSKKDKMPELFRKLGIDIVI